MTGTLIKSLVFTLVTVLATAALAATIRNDGGGPGREYSAVFSDVTSLNEGDDVRMSGVKVGTVAGIELVDDRVAEVSFSVSEDIELTTEATAELRFRNLVGQRYIALEPGAPTAPAADAGHRFPAEQTQPALDLTVLFNGFQPLFRLLDPKDVNTLSAQVIAVFQGEGATVESLLASTASLTSTLAEKDQVIGELITHLESVLSTVNDRSGQLDTTIVTLQRLVSGLAEDSAVIGQTLEGLGDLTGSVADLAEEGRAPLKGSITALGELSENLAADDDVVEDFLQTLPTKLDRIGRLGSYGSWLNTYVCSIEGRIPLPEGYLGDLGAQPVAGRCS
ncbi:MCE family protein [Nocardioides pantholopis]|uniref:MCE family protein n=1 Tax=Nocardioides pantholopis TaxID=2483798 RepID=UPI0013DE2800|nr:MlaD family protein [Nocardioides pantholopis]